MIVPVDKWKGKGIYLARAEQYARSMIASSEKRDWDACVGGAIHCAISAQDAFCIHAGGRRYKGTDHRASAEFFSSLKNSEEHKKAFQRVISLLTIKTDAEYGDRQLTEKEAQAAIINAERLLSYIKACVMV